MSGLLERSVKGMPIRTVAVVDSPSFAVDHMTEQSEVMKCRMCGSANKMAQQLGYTTPDVSDERWGSLLAEQIEAADLMLLNKADVASDVEIQQALSLTGAINPDGDVRITEQGCIDPYVFLGHNAALTDSAVPKPSSSDNVATVGDTKQGMKNCCVTRTCKSKPTLAEQRFGIKSFVYTADRPFSRGCRSQEEPASSPFGEHQ